MVNKVKNGLKTFHPQVNKDLSKEGVSEEVLHLYPLGKEKRQFSLSGCLSSSHILNTNFPNHHPFFRKEEETESKLLYRPSRILWSVSCMKVETVTVVHTSIPNHSLSVLDIWVLKKYSFSVFQELNKLKILDLLQNGKSPDIQESTQIIHLVNFHKVNTFMSLVLR